MPFETLLYEVADRVATVTLNRPAKLNAYTPRMGHEIVEAMRQADTDPSVRLVILTGAGRAFCAGADVSTFEHNIRTRDAGGQPHSSAGREAMADYPHLMRKMSKPSLVAINGFALGVGATMTLPCDIRIVKIKAAGLCLSVFGQDLRILLLLTRPCVTLQRHFLAGPARGELSLNRFLWVQLLRRLLRQEESS
jgi:enoyl-CoA hydratase/carnithine racemase